MSLTDKNQIIEVVEHYFQGTYTADKEKLQFAFHPQAHITGNFSGDYVDFSLSEFIARVCQASAKANHEKYDKHILSIDMETDVAIVKAKVWVGEGYCLDYISLIKIAGKWCIRHKIFTNQIN